MLIKLTDRCTMACPHCLDDAREEGHDMTFDTFRNAVMFALYIGSMHLVLSGGEPSENECITEMCEYLSRIKMSFSIASNGMWLKDETKRERIKRITRMKGYIAMQVYTNKKWYREYDYVVNHIEDYSRFSNVIVDVDSPIHMQDLGRARYNAEAKEEVERNPYFMSCLNTALCARQVSAQKDFGGTMAARMQFCHPSVDCHGNVSMSESRLCQSVGNVNTDSWVGIWKNMVDFRPCGRCSQYRKFMGSSRRDIEAARKILGI